MQYEKPDMEIILFQMNDVITLSVGYGDGENVDDTIGGWG